MPGIHDDRNGRLLDDDLDLRPRLDSTIAADGRTERHHRGRSHLLKPLGENGVGIDIWKDGEALLHELLCGQESFDRVGKKISRVGMDLQLYPFWQSRGRCEPRQPDRFRGIHGAARYLAAADISRDR